METGDNGWIDLRQHEGIEKILEEEEIFLAFEKEEIIEAKMKEIESWYTNGAVEEVRDEGQTTMSIRWIITEKIKEGKKCCKARLVVRGLEECVEGISTNLFSRNTETVFKYYAIQ